MINPLSKVDARNWIGDGTDGSNVSVKTDNESTIMGMGGGKRGTPYNIRLNDESETLSASDSLYFESTLCDDLVGNIAVGLVTEKELQPGWRTSGMFYNGNVTNGSAGLTIGFGPYIKKGDTVGVYLQKCESSTKTIFYLNGRCLGAAFDLKAASSIFYPCLHLDGKADVKFTVPQSLPTVVNREAENCGDSYSGDWLLKQAFTGPELGELPLPSEAVTLSLKAMDPTTYKLNFKADNSIFTSFVIDGKIENFDKIKKIGPAGSTYMMPSPEMDPVEKFISSALDGGLSKTIVSDGGKTLILNGPVAEMICVRYEKEFSPLQSYKN